MNEANWCMQRMRDLEWEVTFYQAAALLLWTGGLLLGIYLGKKGSSSHDRTSE
jgi:hypothetical protein